MRDTQYLWHLLQVAAQAALILVPQTRLPSRQCNALFCCNRDAVKPLQALKHTHTYVHAHTHVPARVNYVCVCVEFVFRIRTSN